MLYKNRDIWKSPVRRGHLQVLNPETEWIDAAHFDLMSYRSFRKMPIEYQEKIIAAYRVKRQTDAVIEYDMRPRK